LRTCADGQYSDRQQLGYCWDEVKAEVEAGGQPRGGSGKGDSEYVASNAVENYRFVPFRLIEEVATAAGMMLGVGAPPRLHPLHVLALGRVFLLCSPQTANRMLGRARYRPKPLESLAEMLRGFLAATRSQVISIVNHSQKTAAQTIGGVDVPGSEEIVNSKPSLVQTVSHAKPSDKVRKPIVYPGFSEAFPIRHPLPIELIEAAFDERSAP
jgi:hypothetical protein